MGILATGTKTVTTGGFAERLTDLEIGVVAKLTIEALSTNTNDVYFGDRAVSSSTGGTLPTINSVGATKLFTNQDPRKVWIDVTTDGEGVKWIAEQ